MTQIQVGEVLSNVEALVIVRDGEIFNPAPGEPIYWGDTLVNEGSGDAEVLLRAQSSKQADSMMVIAPRAQAKVIRANEQAQVAGASTQIDAQQGVEIYAMEEGRPSTAQFVGEETPASEGMFGLLGAGLLGGGTGMGLLSAGAAGAALLGVGLLAAGSDDNPSNPSSMSPAPSPTPPVTEPPPPVTPGEESVGGLNGTLTQVAQSLDNLAQPVPGLGDVVNTLTDALVGASPTTPSGITSVLGELTTELQQATAGVPVVGELSNLLFNVVQGESSGGVSGLLADVGSGLQTALASTPLSALGDGLDTGLSELGGVLGLVGQNIAGFTEGTPAEPVGELLTALLGTEPSGIFSGALPLPLNTGTNNPLSGLLPV